MKTTSSTYRSTCTRLAKRALVVLLASACLLLASLVVSPESATSAYARPFEPNPDTNTQADPSSPADTSGSTGSSPAVDTDIPKPTQEWGENASTPDTFVYDQKGIFDSSQAATLESRAQELAQEYDMGVYLLTTSYMDGLANPTSSQRTAYATRFYTQNDQGIGSGHDGIMFVIAVDSRDYVTIAYGQGSYSFDDEGIEIMEDDVTSYLGDDEWYKGATAYYDQIGAQLAYYAQHEKPGHPLTALDWALRLLIIFVVPLPIAGLVVYTQVKSMCPVRERNEATEYLDRNSLNIEAATDTFLTTTVVATPRASSSSGGSGGGSGGGGWGGGGGGGFSSSGGGKF